MSKDDIAQSILIGSFIKPFVQLRSKADDPDDAFLNFTIDKIFPITLDVLAEDAPHISDMIQRIQASLNLYILLKGKFKDHQKIIDLTSNI